MDLPRAIDHAIEAFSGLIGDRAITVIAEYPAHFPSVEGDADELSRVISCLVSNAAGLVNQGEVTVRAELLPAGESPQLLDSHVGEVEALPLGGPWAVVRVSFKSDSGAEELSSALEAPAATNGEFTYSRCRSVVETYHGRLWLESLRGIESRLSFAVPLKAAFDDADAADVSSLRKAVETRLLGGQENSTTLLIMLEDEELRTILSEELSAAGYGVVITESGDEILALARVERPDLVLLDLTARTPTAIEVAMVLKQDRRTRAIPVMFLTSVDDSEGVTRMGAVDFVVRPSGTGALIAAVDALTTSGLSPMSRVLVVEPDEVARENTVLVIQSHGYRVTEASAPEEALALAERFRPGMVLVNASLAQERDYWLLRRLRQLSATMSVYVLADALTEADAKAAIHRGASGYSETGKLPDLLRKVKGDRDA